MRDPRRRAVHVTVATLALLVAASPVRGQSTARTLDTLRTPAVLLGPLDAGPDGCDLCHGELELLRQRTSDLARARELVVSTEILRLSAHDTMSCRSCHDGFQRYPHPRDPDAAGPLVPDVTTESCVSCHEEAEELWLGSIHEREEEGADCAECHGVHDILPAADLGEGGPGMAGMNAACVACHDSDPLPPSDPHADTIPCASCHAAHQTEAADAEGSWVAPLAQYETCGACHEEVADSAAADRHGETLREAAPASLAVLASEGTDATATCTSCHGSHGMLAPSSERFAQEMVDECAECHADYADTYFGTYHGKATAVGSEIVATCDDCHGAHAIFPADVPASLVSEERLLETCSTCHEEARPAFVKYDSHPDAMDRSRNAPLFYSFVFMNTILFGTLIVFGLHTLLWWLRLTIDRSRGVGHAIGEGGGHD